MIIEDAELRDIFKTSSEEHLQNLESGLLHLEKYPHDTARLEEVLREAHTLKGDSRMLGVDTVESLLHQLEDSLGAVKRGEVVFSSQMCDRLYQGVDAIRQLAREAVTGESANIDVFSVLAQLTGVDSDSSQPDSVDVDALFSDITTKDSEPVGFNFDALFPDIETIPQVISKQVEVDFIPVPTPPLLEIAAQEQLPQPAEQVVLNSNYQIDTIRVEPQKLDALMSQAGELTVTKIRIAHRMAEIEEIMTLWEEWSRDSFTNRLFLDNLERGSSRNGTSTQVQNFHHRTEQRLERLGLLVNTLRNTAYEDTARLDVVVNELESGIRTLRLLPLSTMFNLFPRMVRDLAKQQSKEINLIIEGGETRADKRILEEMKDPLMHMIRNAIDHGIETPQEREILGKPRTATLRLRGYQTTSTIGIELVDDGRGLDIDGIKQTALRRGVCSAQELAAMSEAQIHSLIFAPGFSTRTTITELSGRGVGLDVVRANVERLKGSIQVESTLGLGCKFQLQLSATVATNQVLIVEVNRVSYAVPVEFVQTTLRVSQNDIFTLEGCQTIALNDQPLSIAPLADLLELQTAAVLPPAGTKMLPCIILQVGEERLGLLVDALLDEQNVVLKPQSKLLKRIRNISGATILSTGEVCMVLNPQDLLKSVRKRSGFTAEKLVEQKKQTILLVEDSIIIRTQLKRLLEGAGYQVTAAVDGLDGYNKLKANTFDAVVSDVEMPNLNGLALTAKIRQHKEYNELPIILCTTLASEDDRRRGAEAGANAYLTKGTFDQKVLLDTLKRLV